MLKMRSPQPLSPTAPQPLSPSIPQPLSHSAPQPDSPTPPQPLSLSPRHPLSVHTSSFVRAPNPSPPQLPSTAAAGGLRADSWRAEEPSADGPSAEGLRAEGLGAGVLRAEEPRTEVLRSEGMRLAWQRAEGLGGKGLRAEGLRAEPKLDPEIQALSPSGAQPARPSAAQLLGAPAPEPPSPSAVQHLSPSAPETPTHSASQPLTPSAGGLGAEEGWLEEDLNLEQLFLRWSSQPGDLLDRELDDRNRRIAPSRTWTIFCCSTPFYAFFSTRISKFLMILPTLACFVLFSRSLLYLFAYQYRSAKALRVTASRPAVLQLSPVLEGCAVTTAGRGVQIQDVFWNFSSSISPSESQAGRSQLSMDFDGEITLSGWQIILDDWKDEVIEFEVEALSGDSWELIGTNTLTCGLTVDLVNSTSFLSRGPGLAVQAEVKRLSYDFRAPACVLPLSLQALEKLARGVSFAGAWLAATHGIPRRAAGIIIVGGLVAALIDFAAATIMQVQGRSEESYLAWFSAMKSFVFPGSLIYLPQAFFVELVLIHAVLDYVGYFTAPVHAGYFIPAFGMMATVVGGGLMLLRTVVRFAASTAVRKDRLRFDALWKEMLEDPSVRDGILQLEQVVKESSAFLPGPGLWPIFDRDVVQAPGLNVHPYFLHYCRDSPLFRDFVSKSLSCDVVQSLDQLYEMCESLYPIFLKKVQYWAFLSDGAFETVAMSASEGRFMKWRYAVGHGMEDHIQWPELKPVRRAVEKLWVCSEQDVAQLRDCCRQRIIFDSTDQIAKCLQAVSADPSISIIRIKNTLSPSSQAIHSAGYRHLMLNCRIENNDTRRLGLERICVELQCSLKAFVEIRTNDLHQRYLNFRNTRFTRKIPCFDPRQGAWPLRFGIQSQSRRKRDIGSPNLLRLMPDSALEAQSEATQSEFGGSRADASEDSHDSEDENGSLENSLTPNLTSPVASQTAGSMILLIPRSKYPEASEGHAIDHGVPGSDSGASHKFMLQSVLIQRHCWPGNVLDLMRKEIRSAFRLAQTDSVWFSSSPALAAASKPSMQLLMLLLGVYFMCSFVLKFMSTPSITGRAFRLRTTRVRSGSTNFTTVGVNSFGIYQSGCLASSAMKETLSSSTYTVSFEQEVQVNGWFFSTSSKGAPHDATEFVIERSFDADIWQPLIERRSTRDFCSLLWHPTPSRAACFESRNFFLPSKARKHQHSFFFGLPWYFFLAEHFKLLLLSIGFLLCFACSVAGQYMIGKEILVAALALSGLVQLAGAYAATVLEDSKHVVFPVLIGFADLLLAGVISAFEKFVIHYFIVHGFLLVMHTALERWSSGSHNANPPYAATGMIAFASLILILRSNTLQRSKKGMLQDKMAYDKAWDGILAAESENVRDLCVATEKQNRFTVHERQQYVYQSKEHSRRISGHLTVAADLEHDVQNLDCLYAQAQALYHLLLNRVQRWALAANAKFPVEGSNGMEFHTWKALKKNRALRTKVNWPALKSVDRSVDKVSRCYRNDASRLVDICRHCMVFENIADLKKCFDTICMDPEIVVVRVKNKLDPEYNSWDSAGFRHCLVNIRMVTDRTKLLGLAGHVAELQLVPEPLMLLKQDNKHARYVTYRNSRCK